MTVNDWLSDVGTEIEPVITSRTVFTKGVRETVNGVEISITLTDQSDYYDVYVVAHHKDDSKGIEDAEESVRAVQDVLRSDDKSVSTEKKNRWAESNFKVEPEMIKKL